MTRTVCIDPYNPLWPKQYEDMAKKIQTALGENCVACYHIGSTSVPGLAAKPIIDILPVVQNIYLVDQCNEQMKLLGFTAKGEYGILFRRFFQIEDRFNVHVFEEGNTEIGRHLNFKNWLINHDDDRLAYEKLKVELAKKFSENIFNYCNGKADFVQEIDRKAGFDGIKLVRAFIPKEWHYIHRYVEIPPESRSIDDTKEFATICIYKSNNIVGYIDLQKTNNQAKVLSEHFENNDIREHSKKLIARWLQHM